MALYSDNQIKEMIKELRAPRWGHGAFGESERYDPSQRDLNLADILEEVLKERHENSNRR